MTLRSKYLELLEKGRFGDAYALLASNGIHDDAIPAKLAEQAVNLAASYDLLSLMAGHADHPIMFNHDNLLPNSDNLDLDMDLDNY